MKQKQPIKAKVLDYLKTGHALDNAKAMAMFGYFRLSQAVHSLRNDGHPIATGIFSGPEGNTISYYRHLYVGMKVVAKTDDHFDGRSGVVDNFDGPYSTFIRVRLEKTATAKAELIDFEPTELVLVQ